MTIVRHPQFVRSAHRFQALVAAVMACAAVTGCADAVGEVEAVAAKVDPQAPALTPAKITSQLSQQSSAGAPILTALSITPTRSDAAEGAQASDYQPPFPDRIELFVPPKRLGAAPVDGAPKHSVVLMGFVRVDKQRVVLAIDGNVASIPEGGAQFGVQALSIKPPTVELQRGSQRWRATLE